MRLPTTLLGGALLALVAAPAHAQDATFNNPSLVPELATKAVKAAVEACRARRRYLDALDEYFALTARLGAAEATDTRVDDDLRRRIAEKRAEVDEAVQDVGADWTALLGALETNTQRPETDARRARDRDQSTT